MKKKRNKRVETEAFIKAWQGADNIEAVCAATGMKVQSAQYRARLYRKRGIKLQSFEPRRGAPSLDVAALNKLAQASVTKAPKRIAAKKASKKTTKKSKKK